MQRLLLASSILPFFALMAACDGGGTGGSGGGQGGQGAGDPTRITTDKGPVQGSVAGETRVFLGIPYAAPPLGDLRWKPPAAHAAWTEPVDATFRRPSCPQLQTLGNGFDASSNEDCLTLNVWAPKDPPQKPVPVMVWVHGGSFVFGSGASADYDGQKLAETSGAIVVTINYRLGPLGFLAHPALRNEDPNYPSAAMYGFEDQRMALTWVKNNIAAFGGDAGNVTLFGESAGGISTCLHLLSPKSQGLFHRVIIESGACALGRPSGTEQDAEVQGAEFAQALGCDSGDAAQDLACLRGKPVEEVILALPTSAVDIAGSDGANWFPVVDGLNIADEPDKLLEQGAINKVPVLLGSNQDEGTIFFAFGGKITDEAGYLALVEKLVPGKGMEIVNHYPSATYGSPQKAAEVAFGDAAFVCPARRTARALVTAGVPTYRYRFAHAGKALLANLGAFHSGEIPFVFGHPTQLMPESPNAMEEPLAQAMMGYWSRMADKGDPNGGGAPNWPAYELTTEPNIVLDLTISTETQLKKADCDFWDNL